MLFVKVALRQPVTTIVMVILILLGGMRATATTAVDMFPDINIPEVAVVWTYNGLLPDEMADRIGFFFERLQHGEKEV
jgi:multidrug efflux pump subunit AcrB